MRAALTSDPSTFHLQFSSWITAYYPHISHALSLRVLDRFSVDYRANSGRVITMSGLYHTPVESSNWRGRRGREEDSASDNHHADNHKIVLLKDIERYLIQHHILKSIFWRSFQVISKMAGTAHQVPRGCILRAYLLKFIMCFDVTIELVWVLRTLSSETLMRRRLRLNNMMSTRRVILCWLKKLIDFYLTMTTKETSKCIAQCTRYGKLSREPSRHLSCWDCSDSADELLIQFWCLWSISF